MSLFLEILTIVILIFLIKECFTIHMGLICAYSNTPYFLFTFIYIIFLNLLRIKGIIIYDIFHIIPIIIITIAFMTIYSFSVEVAYNKTHPRDDVRLIYETIIIGVIVDRFDNSLDYIIETYDIADAFTDILKFNDLEDEVVESIANHVFDEVPLEHYDSLECEQIQYIIRRDYPNLKEEL